MREGSLGQRLDRALVDALKHAGVVISRAQLSRAFAAGVITHEGRPLKPSRIIDADLDVDVELVAPEPLRARAEALPLCVLYEDDHVLVVDKAAEMVVHASAGHHDGTLVNAVLHHLGVKAEQLPVMPGNDDTRPGIVHRLDRGTSGVLVVAKHAAAQQGLADQFRVHSIVREYIGIVIGLPTWTRRSLETTHARDPKDRRRFTATASEGRRAATHMRVEQRLRGAAKLRFALETGRTHQIRVHAAHLGHPIFGDVIYGGTPHEASLRERYRGWGRHALHAAVLGFRHPMDARSLRFESPLPADMAALLAELEVTG